MTILPASNIINVTITDTPSGLTQKNVNSLALFTQDAPINLESYGIYISAAQVAANYGTSSKTAQMATAAFSQTPNMLSGDGRLVIIPMLAAVSATKGKFDTANISANLSNLIAVTSGDIKLTINSVVQNVTGLNFTGCLTLSDVAAVLQAKLIDCTVAATTTVLTVTSNKVGTSSTVAMAAVSGGTGTNLAGSTYFNSASGTATAGANSS
jgi:hypothetical protein